MRYRMPLGSVPARRRPANQDQAGDMGLAGFIIELAAAGARNAIDLTIVSGANEQRPSFAKASAQM
jgi:hypothetical protein